MSVVGDFQANLARMLSLGGTDGQLVYAEDSTGERPAIRFLLNHPTSRDDAVVNAYGVSALVLTIPATAGLLAKPPRKFDVVLVKGQKPYALDAVKAHQLANTVVAFTCYVKGKGE